MLPEPTTSSGAAALARLVGAPAGALVAVDFDGTLAPIATRAEDARADPEALAALARVAAVTGSTVVLTGRPAAVAVEYGGLAAVPGLTVLGHYGLQRWVGGALQTPPPDPRVVAARAELPSLPAGAYVEDKGLSFVVHTRTATDPAVALAAVDAPLRALAAARGLEVVDGSFARELRPPGTDKGTTLLALAAAMPAGVVVVLGDDDGDLPAADAVAELRAGGTPGLVVCAAREGGSIELRERADLVVDGVAGVTAFLTAVAAAVSGGT